MIPPAIAALFLRALRFDAADPAWADADRLVAEPACAPILHDALMACGAGASPAIEPAGAPGLALGVALGLTLGERLLAARFGRSLVDHRVWCLADQAGLRAGVALEAAALAGALGAARLSVLAGVPPGGVRELAVYAAMGWAVRQVHGAEEAAAALSAAARGRKPTLIAWPMPDQIPAASADEVSWQQAGQRGAGARRAWLRRLRRHAAREAFLAPVRAPAIELPVEPTDTTANTAKAALMALALGWPELCAHPASSRGFAWDRRPAAAAAAALGLALHGGLAPVLPVGAGELPAAMPALMAAGAAAAPLVLLGADPPLGLPPGVTHYRPATAAECLACLSLALRGPGPAYMEVSAGPAAPLGTDTAGCARGAAPLFPEGHVTIAAGGTDLAAALAAREALAGMGVAASVISVPCPTRAALGPALRVGLEVAPDLPRGASAAEIVRQVRAERTAASRFLEKSDDLLESPAQLD